MLKILPTASAVSATRKSTLFKSQNISYANICDTFVYSRKLSFGNNNHNEETINWYDKNSENYFNETKDFSMKEKYTPFLKHIPKNGEILDAGCGSGRDAKCFSEMGYNVTAFDASSELTKLAEKNCGFSVMNTTFAKFKSAKKFDGIWACASLLHVPKKDFEESFLNLTNHLKNGGILCASMKLGEVEEKDSKGRFFNYVSVEELKNIFSKQKNLQLIEMTQAENTFRAGDHPFVTFVVKKIKNLV